MKYFIDYLEKAQIDEILAIARSCSERDYLMMRVLWRSGIRIGELLSLRPHDIGYDNRVISVVKATRGNQRRVPLDVTTLAELRGYIRKYGIAINAPLFPVSKPWARELIKRYGWHVGKHVYPRTFRHSYAVNMIRHGVDFRKLQQVLGRPRMSKMSAPQQFNDKELHDAYGRVPF
ncbi:MAG: tyrosine-type recombinase/integrase [Halobacteriota archaeon]